MSTVSSIADRSVSVPSPTIWGFLSQVLGETIVAANAVSKIIAHRAAAGPQSVFAQHRQLLHARARIPTAVLRCLPG